ncbi:MAG: hypothetical protein EA379_05125 [Phycisphaerales bacterium]|nr:MAG: hypothetical protein EA379_05125 [Phycisphaerales bacterium]
MRSLRGAGRAREALRCVRPRTPAQLHAWLALVAGVDAQDEAMDEGSSAPLGYVAHAFFGGGDSVVWACRGGGKTFYAACATMLDALFKPGIEVRILGGSLEQSLRMQAHLRGLFERPALRSALDGRPTERRVRLANGSVVEALAQSHTSVRGCRPQVLRCDEAELFDPEVWKAAQLATRSRVCADGRVARGRVEALSTMHRAHGLMSSLVGGKGGRTVFRWGVADVLERCDDRYACDGCALAPECAGRAKLGRGSRGHITIADALALKARTDHATWESEMRCRRPRRDDLVLPEFDRAVHVFGEAPEARDPAQAPPGARWLVGMDFGFRVSVMLFACIDGEGVLRVMEERIAREETIGAHASAVLESVWPRPEWMGVDPAGAQRSSHSGLSDIGALRRAGLRVRWRRTGVEEGLRMVRARLRPASGAPSLFVHARCRGLIEALESYRYATDPRTGAPTGKPVKDGADHAADALRYLVVNAEIGPAVCTNYL